MMRAGNERRAQGFTLLELLAVMAIMAVLMTAGIAAFFGVGQEARMRGAIQNVRTTLSLARQRAILARRPVGVNFEPNGTYYAANMEVTGSNIKVKETIGDKRHLPPGIQFKSSKPEPIAFASDGTVGTSIPDIELVTADKPDKIWEIKVWRLTGLTTVNAP